MSIALPSIALGIEIPNPTLSLPDSTGQTVAGWTVSGATSVTGYCRKENLPSVNHGRILLASKSSSGSITIVSGPGPYGRAVGGDGAKFSALLLPMSGESITGSAKIQFLNSSGTVLATELQLNPANFGVGLLQYIPIFLQSTGGTAPPAGSVSVRLQLVFTGSTAFSILLAFACPGVWDSATYGYLDLTSYPGSGSKCVRASREFQRDYRGRAIYNDALMQADPFLLEIPWDLVPLVDYRALKRAYEFHCGTPGDNPNVPYIPSGGHWPLLLKPGHPDLPQAGLYEFESFDLNQDGDYIREDGYYSGTIRLRERV